MRGATLSQLLGDTLTEQQNRRKRDSEEGTGLLASPGRKWLEMGGWKDFLYYNQLPGRPLFINK